MRTSDLLIGVAVFGLWSAWSTASAEAQIYTAAPPRPLLVPGATAARGAAAVQLGYDARLRIYTNDSAAVPHEVQQPSHVTTSVEARADRATNPGWTMRGYDPGNTGRTTGSGPAAQAAPAWVFQPDPGTFVWRPASAPDGTIYVTTVFFPPTGVVGRLYALHGDGSVKWQTELTDARGTPVWTSATPVVDSAGNIYVAWAHDLDSASLTAISLDSSGNVRWRFEPQLDLQYATHQQPVLGDSVLYAAVDTSFRLDDPTHRASILALDLATGKPVWHWISPNLDTFFDGPAVGRDGYVYHVSAANDLRGASGYLYRLRPDGMLDWAIDIGPGAAAPPAIDAANNVYVGDLVGVVSKHSASGVRLWAYDTLSGQIFTSPAINGRRVTVSAAHAGLHVLNAYTGALDTVFAPDKFPLSQATDRAGNAFFYAFDATGTVLGFGHGGRQLWTFETGAAASVSAVAIATDGKLLVGNSQTLTAYVAPTLGDLNCDHAVDGRDVGPYFLALTAPESYAKRHPRCQRALADVNGDGVVNAHDTLPFLRLLD